MHEPLNNPSDTPTSRAYWIVQLFSWGSYCGWQTYEERVLVNAPWRKAVTMWFCISLLYLGLTHLLRYISKRYSWLTLPPSTLLVRVCAAVFVNATVSFLVVTVLSSALYHTQIEPSIAALSGSFTPSLPWVYQFSGFLAVHVGWTAVYFGLTLQRHRHRVELRQVQLSNALRAAELRLLKSQLNPHFLFNALNGIRALTSIEPQKARDAITQLSRMLRYTLAAGEDDTVTLARELEMIDDYLALESLRLGARLRVLRDIEPAATVVRIPVMLLQTLIENAIKHGIAPLKEGGTLQITARIVGSHLQVRIEDPRPPVAIAAADGRGLKNSAERLRLLFGANATLTLDLSHPDRAIAQLTLPI